VGVTKLVRDLRPRTNDIRLTVGHSLAAGAAVCTGVYAHLLSLNLLGNMLVAGSGFVLMWPTTARPQPELLWRVWALVSATQGDPLAPFAMHSGKSYHFNAEKTAAIAYRTRLGFAVVSATRSVMSANSICW
jgi:lysylphosphatidylglycerol synthetase-like protein (DUF2156 family)